MQANKQNPRVTQLQLIHYTVFSKHTMRILTPSASSEKRGGKWHVIANKTEHILYWYFPENKRL